MSNFEMTDMGEYHDPALRLERTDVAQQGFEAMYQDWSHLDGQVYQPSPHDIPDTREGFDISGCYHRMSRVEPCVSGLDESPYARGLRLAGERQRLVSSLVQQIIGECVYKPDLLWSVWHEVHELEDTNALPTGVTADDLFQHYLKVYESDEK